jgi:hypothetical protein
MKEMLVLGKFKEGKFEKFMGFMQLDEGMAERKKIADVTKTVAAVTPDKGAVMFKITVHNEQALRDFLSGKNPVSKPIFDERVASTQVWELTSA